MQTLTGMLEEQPYLTKAQWVAAQLRRRILMGDIKPGDKLREQEVASWFRCSPTPVREAIRILGSEGLVNLEPHRPPTVTELRLDGVEEVYLVQAHLQRLAIVLSAKAYTPERIQRARQINEQMRQSLVRGDLKPLRILNYEFHLSLFDGGRLDWLTRIIAGLWARYPDDTLSTIPGRAAQSVAEHDEILATLEAGDVKGAGQLMMEHHWSSAESLLDDSRRVQQMRDALDK